MPPGWAPGIVNALALVGLCPVGALQVCVSARHRVPGVGMCGASSLTWCAKRCVALQHYRGKVHVYKICLCCCCLPVAGRPKLALLPLRLLSSGWNLVWGRLLGKVLCCLAVSGSCGGCLALMSTALTSAVPYRRCVLLFNCLCLGWGQRVDCGLCHSKLKRQWFAGVEWKICVVCWLCCASTCLLNAFVLHLGCCCCWFCCHSGLGGPPGLAAGVGVELYAAACLMSVARGFDSARVLSTHQATSP